MSIVLASAWFASSAMDRSSSARSRYFQMSLFATANPPFAPVHVRAPSRCRTNRKAPDPRFGGPLNHADRHRAISFAGNSLSASFQPAPPRGMQTHSPWIQRLVPAPFSRARRLRCNSGGSGKRSARRAVQNFWAWLKCPYTA